MRKKIVFGMAIISLVAIIVLCQKAGVRLKETFRESEETNSGAVSDAHRNAAAAAKTAADHEAGPPERIEPCRVVREELIVRAENRADEGQPHHAAVRVPAQNEIGT